MFAQLYFLLYCPSVFGTAGLSGNSHPRPQALRPTRPVHTELRRTKFDSIIPFHSRIWILLESSISPLYRRLITSLIHPNAATKFTKILCDVMAEIRIFFIIEPAK